MAKPVVDLWEQSWLDRLPEEGCPIRTPPPGSLLQYGIGGMPIDREYLDSTDGQAAMEKQTEWIRAHPEREFPPLPRRPSGWTSSSRYGIAMIHDPKVDIEYLRSADGQAA